MRTTHAKGADGNECATDDGAERSERIDRHEDHPGAIIRAIVGGERDGKNLAEFRDPKVKASKETIAKSLEGTWLPEQFYRGAATGRLGPCAKTDGRVR